MDFRTALVGLMPYISNIHDLVEASDWVVRNVPTTPIDPSTHEGRVQAALTDPEVMQQMRDGKKINAIKRLRTITGAGLYDAKRAVEDVRVVNASGYRSPYSYN